MDLPCDTTSEALLASAQFRPFLADGFDAASFASRSLAEGGGTTAQAQTEALQAGVAALDGALRQLVLRHQDGLLQQASRLADGEAAVQRIGLSVRSLQMVAARVRGEVWEPYQQIAARTQQLANLQATVDLLRHVIHRLKLVQKLRQQMGGGAQDAGAWLAWDGCFDCRGLLWVSGWHAYECQLALLPAQPAPMPPPHLPAAPPLAHILVLPSLFTLPPRHLSLLPVTAGILEVAKAAKLLSEIAAVDAEADLAGVDAVDADAEFLATAAAIVRSQTEVSGWVGGRVGRGRAAGRWQPWQPHMG